MRRHAPAATGVWYARFDAHQAGRDGRQHEDAFEALAEDEDGDVEHARAEIAVRERVRQAAGAQHLEDEHRRHGGDAQGQEEGQDT